MTPASHETGPMSNGFAMFSQERIFLRELKNFFESICEEGIGKQCIWPGRPVRQDLRWSLDVRSDPWNIAKTIGLGQF